MSHVDIQGNRSTAKAAKLRWAAVAVVIALALIAVAVIGMRAWNAHFALSQASQSDCARAQEIINSGRTLTHDKEAADAWVKEMTQRHQGMDDGYLQYQVAVYESIAKRIATGVDKPTATEIKELVTRLNGHCAKWKLDVAFPPSP